MFLYYVKKLRLIFEYQRFENNSRLARIISETENRYGTELSDSDLEFISAAGEINPDPDGEN